MHTEPRKPTPFHDHVAAVEKAEARYMQAWRRVHQQGAGDAERELAAARQNLRRTANDAVRALARITQADAVAESGEQEGVSAEVGGRVVWYDLDQDAGKPGWTGRDDRTEGDARLDAHELEHWLRAGRVHP